MIYCVLSLFSSIRSVNPKISFVDSRELLLFLIVPITFTAIFSEKGLKKAIKINPKYAEAYTNRGVVYLVKSQYDKAIKSYKEEIEEYDRIINTHNKIFKEKRAELTKINNELNNRIYSIAEELSELFNEYSKHFNFKDLKLMPYEGRKPRAGI